MKRFSHLLLIFCLVLLGTNRSSGQIALQYTDTTLCPGMPLVMCAALTGQGTDITRDDIFSIKLDIGFDFVYFGKTYNRCVVGSNGTVNFDTTLTGQGSLWTWGLISSISQANNSIFCAFFDMHPQPGDGKIRYQRFGQPGSRRFVVEWCNVATYNISTSCGALRTTTELVLYEGTNYIEMHTTKLPAMSFSGPCPGASGGYYGQVIQGVRNENGTLQFFAPNRDPVVSATNWGVTGVVNDGMRFTPNGTSTYISSSIPFDPWVIIDEASSPDLKWYAEGDPNLPIATGPCASAVANANVNYYVVNFNGNAGCSPTAVDFYDTVHIHFGTSYDTTDAEICAGSTIKWFGKDLFKAGNYDTLLSTTMGCDSFLRLRLHVNPLPDVTLKGTHNVEICEGSSTTLALLNPNSSVTYQWYKDNVPVSGETGSTILVNQAGKYKVEATTGKGCKSMSDMFSLQVNPIPVATIQPITGEIICSYDTLQLTAVAGSSYDYRWSPEKPFRIVTGAEGQKVKGVFIDQETLVTLTVYNQFGCYDTATVMVHTKPCCEVFVPNAFTPNGDGNNEYFQPELQLGQILVSMKIFDRYGKLVYDNTNIKKGWDGKYDNGKEASSGTYMYMMKYTCSDGKVYDKKESVTLIR
jgi:gliding motility-associated-like protein